MKKTKNIGPRYERRPLKLECRQYILKMRDMGMGIREISRRLGRSHSVVSRFLRSIPYSPFLSKLSPLELAYEMNNRSTALRRKSRRKLRLKSYEIQRYVEEKLELGLSPELIAGRLQLEHPGLKTNYESIYQWLYRERTDLIRYLEVRGKNKRRKRSGTKPQRRRQPSAPKTSIEERPDEVQNRTRVGDWEGDTIVSKQSKTAILNVIERSTRFLHLRKIPDCTGETGLDAMADIFSQVPPGMIKTLTLDNGPENSMFKKLGAKVGIETYFCHPYCASERGTVENRNGFLRRYIPKKTDLESITQERLEEIQHAHNNRPMKVLNFRTPHEVYWEAFKEHCHA